MLFGLACTLYVDCPTPMGLRVARRLYRQFLRIMELTSRQPSWSQTQCRVIDVGKRRPFFILLFLLMPTGARYSPDRL